MLGLLSCVKDTEIPRTKTVVIAAASNCFGGNSTQRCNSGDKDKEKIALRFSQIYVEYGLRSNGVERLHLGSTRV